MARAKGIGRVFHALGVVWGGVVWVWCTLMHTYPFIVNRTRLSVASIWDY